MVEGAAAAAIAVDGGATISGCDIDQHGGFRIIRNLTDEFHQVDGYKVQPMPSANLAMAINEVGRLPQTPKLTMATAMLKVAVVQVFQIHDNQAPSHSIRSN
jgi:hypothetical protein